MSELSGAELDLAVAKALGWLIYANGYCDSGDRIRRPIPYFSSDWAQGGPILVKYWDEICYELSEKYSDAYNDWPSRIKGKEFLIAAMRALVASKEVEDD